MVPVLTLTGVFTSLREEAFGCQFVVLTVLQIKHCKHGRELDMDKQTLQATAK